MKRRARGDDAVSSVVGAIVILAVMGLAIVYVNGVHVPRQGAALETAAHEEAERAIRALAAQLGSPASDDGGLAWSAPLRPPEASPPLLSGIILSPPRHDGSVAAGAGATISISHVVNGNPSDPADPMRESVANGRMRVWILGNRDGGVDVGGVSLRPGAGQLSAVTYTTTAGAVLAERDGRVTLLEGLGLTARLADADRTTSLSWRLPIVAGAAEATGGSSALVRLDETASGATQTRGTELTIRVTTAATEPWRLALEDALGAHGTVTVEEGAVVATILPPAGAPGNSGRVSLDLQVARYEASVTARSA